MPQEAKFASFVLVNDPEEKCIQIPVAVIA